MDQPSIGTKPTNRKSRISVASINIHRNRLYLLANLPLRDGSSGNKQQRIALKLDNTPLNYRTAKAQLKILENQLTKGTFEWSFWEQQSDGMSWREAIAKLHRARVILGRTSENTWQINYMGRLRQINPSSRCDTKSIEQALLKYDRSTCSYKELYYLLKHLARLANVAFPEVPLPTYSNSTLIIVPSDQEIVTTIQNMQDSVAWYFGMMATYGLRPHEIEKATIIKRNYCQISDDTKTGFRTVIPLLTEWVDLFDLHVTKIISPVNDARPDRIAKWLSKQLAKSNTGWKPYALRHAYAARLWRMGGSRLDIYTASRLMGHSPQQHTKIYRAHIQPHHVADTAARAVDSNIL